MIYTSSAFQVACLPYYRLIVDSNHEEDVICVLDERQELLAYHRYNVGRPTNEVLKLLSLPFPSITISMPYCGVTFIPQEVYGAEELETYSSFLQFKASSGVLVEEFDGFRTNAVYQLDPVLYNRWHKIYPEADFRPSFSILFQLALRKQKISGSQLLLQFRADTVDYLLVKDGEFLFHNSYVVKTTADLHYYVLQIKEHFLLGERLGRIWCVGACGDWALTKHLEGFADRVIIAEVEEGIQFPEEFSQDTKIEISSLLSTPICV